MVKLIDFTEFEPFNELRSKMCAEQPGSFEMFDPKLHLTGSERSALNQSGVQLSKHSLGYLLDFTLIYKNSRVLVIDGFEFHIAACERLLDKRLSDKESYTVTTSLQWLDKPVTVCKCCLQTLHFNGYDDQKARKEHYSEQVFRRFTLDQFWKLHHKYPVSMQNEVLKPLEHE